MVSSLFRFIERIWHGDTQTEPISLSAVSPVGIQVTFTEAPAPVSADPNALWIAPGRAVTVGGIEIRGGMIYVGENLASVSSAYNTEPALINSKLAIDRIRPDREGLGMVRHYWPSYSEISAACRAAYLEWLASDRSAPNTPIGYIFLYYYGIERRLLSDAETAAMDPTETRALIEEIKRLLSCYGSNRSFQHYAQDLLRFLFVREKQVSPDQLEPPRERSGYELPMALKFALAQFVTEGRPVPAKWAYSWLVCNPETSFRTPAKRCPDEFRMLFEERYGQKYGDGYIVKPPKRNLKIQYKPASASYSGGVVTRTTDLPDISGLSLARLQSLADECEEALEAYSRYVGRAPDEKESLVAVALLPEELVKNRNAGQISALRAHLDSALKQSEWAVIPAAPFVALWPAKNEGKFTKNEMISFIQLLHNLGYGLEPDPRFGGPGFHETERIVVFRQSQDAPQTSTPEYRAMALLFHLASIVAHADGPIGEDEYNYLVNRMESGTQLTEQEKRRLNAHLRWLLITETRTAGLKARLERLDPAHREKFGRFVVGVACADGRIDPAEVKALEKLFRMLGLDPESVYSQLHALTAEGFEPDTGPISVQPAKPAAGHRIPTAPPPVKPSSFKLDKARVAAILEDTAEVKEILGDIFAEDEPEPPSTPSPVLISSSGLDEAHAALAKELIGKDQWTREDFEACAAKLALMADGALDRINEVAFESCGEPLIEGDDVLEINPNAREIFR